jgi:hypothetical protein
LQTIVTNPRLLTQQIIDHIASGGRVKLTLKNRGMRPAWVVGGARFRELAGELVGEVSYSSRRNKSLSTVATSAVLASYDVHLM